MCEKGRSFEHTGQHRHKTCVRTLSYISRVDLQGCDYGGDTSGVGPALARAFQAMEAKVLHVAREDGKDYGSTATVALCFPAHRSLFVAHVGDSRSVLCRWASDLCVLKHMYGHNLTLPYVCLAKESSQVFARCLWRAFASRSSCSPGAGPAQSLQRQPCSDLHKP